MRCTLRTLLPPPRAGEGWGGGRAGATAGQLRPLPNPPPQAGEGVNLGARK